MPEDTDQITTIDPLTVGEILTLEEVSRQSGLSHIFLRHLATKGRLKAKKSGSIWLTTLAAVEEYKRTRERGKRTDLDKRTI